MTEDIAGFLNAVAPNDIGTAVAFTISSPKLWPGLRWCSVQSVWAALKLPSSES